MDKPIVWTLHDSWPFCGVCHYFADCNRYESECGDCPLLHSSKKKDLSYKVWKTKMQTYKQLDLHIVAPSQWLGLCAKHSSLFGQFPVSVIPNCIDTDVFYPQNNNKISPRWDAIEKIKAEKKIVLYGAMNALKDKRKGFKNLLAALQMIDKIGANNNIQLVVFGSDKTGLILNTKIPIEYVGYLTNTDEIVSLFSLSDVMVVPSLDENLSCAIMESLSCQTPVVAFNIGGNSDMIDHQINGYLAKEHDDSDLARGILWCLANNEGNHLGIAGRKKVIEKFSPEVVGKQYLDLYTEAYEEFKSKKKHR
jgi:glycosyltransferase involved in cell wall biosynthesis